MLKKLSQLFSNDNQRSSDITDTVIIEHDLLRTLQGIESQGDEAIELVHVNLTYCWGLFIKGYGSYELFAADSRKRKFNYLMKLLDSENDLRREGKLAESLSVKIIGLYLSTALTFKDESFVSKSNIGAYLKFKRFLDTGLLN